MHLGIVTPFYPPDVSGAGRYVSDLAEGAAEDGHRVTVLHLGGRDEPPSPAGQPTVVGVPPSRLRLTSVAAAVRTVDLHRRDRFDVLVSGVAHPSGVAVGAVSRATGVPLLVVTHSEDLADGAASSLSRRCLGFTFGASSHVAAASRWTRHTALGLGARAEACSVVHPGIDPTPFVEGATADRRRRARARWGLDGRVVLTVARLEDRKGHDTVLRALSRLGPDADDVRYLVVGSGDQEPLRRLGQALGVWDRVTVLSDLGQEELIDAYAAADVFTMLSRPGPTGRVDGFGIVYLEAAASGLPCIAGSLGGCPEAVEHLETGLVVEPTDVPGVAEALAELLSDPDRARRLGARGQERVVRDYSVAEFRRNTTALVHELASGSTRPTLAGRLRSR